MGVAAKTGMAFLMLATLVAASPGLAYVYGISRIASRPIAADSALVDQAARHLAWASCRESNGYALTPQNPWTVAYQIWTADPYQADPGQRATWAIARQHNLRLNLRGGDWHVAGAALSIWISRHWTVDQLSATVARDHACG
jgi:hypothetical protein